MLTFKHERLQINMKKSEMVGHPSELYLFTVH